MGHPARGVCGTAVCRWQVATAAGGACGVECGVVDLSHRNPLEGLSRSLSTLSNQSPAFSEMAEERSLGSDFTGAGRGSSAAGKARPERRSHRRLVRGSEKGGSAVGKTRRGKGTKIMAVTDGHSVPVAVHVASASPREIRLVEAMLDNHSAPSCPKIAGRLGLGQRSSRGKTQREIWCRSDRSSQKQSSPTAYARPTSFTTLLSPLESGTVLCRAAQFSPFGDSLGIQGK